MMLLLTTAFVGFVALAVFGLVSVALERRRAQRAKDDR